MDSRGVHFEDLKKVDFWRILGFGNLLRPFFGGAQKVQFAGWWGVKAKSGKTGKMQEIRKMTKNSKMGVF